MFSNMKGQRSMVRFDFIMNAGVVCMILQYSIFVLDYTVDVYIWKPRPICYHFYRTSFVKR